MTRLTVLRHAKSAWPAGVADHDRPLAARGLRDAPAAGSVLAAGAPIDRVLCSTATRTRQTWAAAGTAFATAPRVDYLDAIYEATTATLLQLLADAGESGHLLLIGHNPGCEELVLHLADPADSLLRDQVAAKFPTSAIAVLDLAPINDHEPPAAGSARLRAFTVPRG